MRRIFLIILLFSLTSVNIFAEHIDFPVLDWQNGEFGKDDLNINCWVSIDFKIWTGVIYIENDFAISENNDYICILQFSKDWNCWVSKKILNKKLINNLKYI